jgi:hypothetical protein
MNGDPALGTPDPVSAASVSAAVLPGQRNRQLLLRHTRRYFALQSLIDTVPAVFYSSFFLVEVRKP